MLKEHIRMTSQPLHYCEKPMKHEVTDGFAYFRLHTPLSLCTYLLSLMTYFSTLSLQVEIHKCAVSDKNVACYCGTLWEFHLHISFWVLLSIGKSNLQGHFHVTNLMHYVLLWIVKKYKLLSGVILASLKHYSVTCKLISAFFFFVLKLVISPPWREN